MSALTRRSVLGAIGALPVAGGAVLASAGSAAADPLAQRIEAVLNRPEFANAVWGMTFRDVETGRILHSRGAENLFVAASTAKVFTAGTAFAALGTGHRFRTRVLRTGPVVRGTLRGDLVLVAGGDLLLSGRIRRDGSLALPQPDHSYGTSPGAGPVSDDPLRELRAIARQVAARGVRRVDGHVRVDDSLFRSGREDIGMGATVTVSPAMVNDNIVDVSVQPGDAVGAPAVLRISPETGYARIVNDVTTVADATAARPLTFVDDVADPDGTRTVRLTGDVPAGGPDAFRAYYVPEPARFAAHAFATALSEVGVRAEIGEPVSGARGHRVAEHVSPPLAEAAKVMLKVSSNVHTVMYPYLVGAIAAGDAAAAKAADTALQRELLEEAGLDPDPPGAAQFRYTSDYLARFLVHLGGRPFYHALRQAFPIMGRDGSLAEVGVDLPAAGHVFAKTGTGLGRSTSGMLVFRGLAGYIRRPDHGSVAFAQFMESPVESSASADELARLAAEAMAEIASAVYETSGAGSR